MPSNTSSPVRLSSDVKKAALANLQKFRSEVLSLGGTEPIFVTDPFGSMTVTKIMEEIEAETPAGVYHATCWSVPEEKILELQRKAARHSQ